MASSKTPLSSWQQALKFINKCPLCGKVYNLEHAYLFAEESAAQFVHITCNHCQSYFVAMILMLGQGLSSVGMITDLSLEDVKRLYKTSAITLDEALSGYQLMKTTHFNSLILNGK